MKFIKGAPVTNWLKPRGPIIYSAFKDNGKSPRRGQGGVTGVRDEGEGCISPAGLWAHGTVDMSVMEKLKNDLHETFGAAGNDVQLKGSSKERIFAEL